MSALGQKRPVTKPPAVSHVRFKPKSGHRATDGHVRFVPKADSCIAAIGWPSFDHLVGELCKCKGTSRPTAFAVLGLMTAFRPFQPFECGTGWLGFSLHDGSVDTASRAFLAGGDHGGHQMDDQGT